MLNSQPDERIFILAQIEEIRRYLENHQEENSNVVVLRWIEEHAAEYRRHWEEEHLVS